METLAAVERRIPPQHHSQSQSDYSRFQTAVRIAEGAAHIRRLYHVDRFCSRQESGRLTAHFLPWNRDAERFVRTLEWQEGTPGATLPPLPKIHDAYMSSKGPKYGSCEEGALSADDVCAIILEIYGGYSIECDLPLQATMDSRQVLQGPDGI